MKSPTSSSVPFCASQSLLKCFLSTLADVGIAKDKSLNALGFCKSDKEN
jgi:hypothetical protein